MAGIKLDLKNSGITEKTISEYRRQRHAHGAQYAKSDKA